MGIKRWVALYVEVGLPLLFSSLAGWGGGCLSPHPFCFGQWAGVETTLGVGSVRVLDSLTVSLSHCLSHPPMKLACLTRCHERHRQQRHHPQLLTQPSPPHSPAESGCLPECGEGCGPTVTSGCSLPLFHCVCVGQLPCAPASCPLVFSLS